MKLLLDTHTLLWAIGKTKELSKKVIKEITDENNEVLVSAASLWEIALKHNIGKLVVDFDIKKIPEYCTKMGFELIPKDPFDRMLIYQCITKKYTLVSKDQKIETYEEDGLKYFW